MNHKSKLSRRRHQLAIRNRTHQKYTNCKCQVCGSHFQGQLPIYCCNGYMCGCYSQPIYPVVCKERCYNKLGYYIKTPLDL